LQDDKIVALLKDDNFRNVLATADFALLMDDAVSRKTIGSEIYAKACATAIGRELFNACETWGMAMQSPSSQTVVGNADFRKLMENPINRQGIATDVFAEAFGKSAIRTMIEQDDFALAMANPTIHKDVISTEFAALLQQPQIREQILTADMKRLKENAVMKRLIGETAFADMIQNPVVRQGLVCNEMANVLLHPTAREVILASELHNVAKQADVCDGLLSQDFKLMMQNPVAMKAFAVPEVAFALLDPGVQHLAVNDVFNRLNEVGLAKDILLSSALHYALSTPDFALAMGSNTVRGEIASTAFARAMEDLDQVK
jgi:hypothetical protein